MCIFRRCLFPLFVQFHLFLLPIKIAANQPNEFVPPPPHQWRALSLEEGNRLTLKCPQTEQLKNIRWFHDGQPLDRHSTPILSIPSLSRSDSGIYRCFAFSEEWGGGQFMATFKVTVEYFDGFVDDPDNDLFQPKFAPNQSFWLKVPRLKVSANGDNLAKKLSWKWAKNGNEIKSDAISHFISSDGDLLLLDPSEAAAGEYSLEVSNGKSKFLSRKYAVEKDPNSRPHSPSFSIWHKPQDVKIGMKEKEDSNGMGERQKDAVKFECVPNMAEIYEIEIRWYLNAEPLDFGAENANDGGMVAKQQAKTELNGRRLVLTNLFGNGGILSGGTRSAVVRCEARANTPDGAQKVDVADARLDIIEMPHINRENLGQKAVKDEGEPLALVCQTDKGWPRPKFSWYFNDQKIENANSEQLAISRLNSQHFGTYQCEAANSAGMDIAAIWVINKRGGENKLAEMAISRGDSTKVEEEGKWIERGPSNQSLVIGSNVHMNCRISNQNNGGMRVGPVWFRNNEEISPSGDLLRRIQIDAEGTLWINQVGPDNSGEYRCVARNKEGQELASQTAWLSIYEKPGMVQNVLADLVNDSSSRNGGGKTGTNGKEEERIRISWSPGFDGNLPVVKWSVEMRILGPNGQWSDWEESMDVLAHQMEGANRQEQQCCSTFVENVRPSATAQFRVLAHNRYGAGKASGPSQSVTMPQRPPAAAPFRVHASARSAQSLMIQWQPPQMKEVEINQQQKEEEEAPQDHIKGYLIRYRLSGYSTADWNERNISDGQARNALIEPLITWREYDVQVAAYNDRGLGVFSRAVTASTLEGIPMQSPQNVKVEVLNSTAIRVAFDPPNPQMVPGVNLGYKVQLWKGPVAAAGGNEEAARNERILPSNGRIVKEIDGLQKNGIYNLTVLCFTAPGDGPRSEPMEFQTAEDIPGPVESLEPVEVFSESALIQWAPPKEPNGQIQKYKLEWWEEGKTTQQRAIEVSGHNRNCTLEGLRAQTKYAMEIRAFTRIGPGPKLAGTFQSGLPPELPGRPSALTISEVGTRKARLHFLAGSDGNAQIKKWLIEWREGGKGSQMGGGGGSGIFSPLAEMPPLSRGTNSILIETLWPNTEYQLRLIAENVRGRSLPSEPSPPFRTQQAVPEHPPHRLWAFPVSSGQISLVWTPLNGREWNGDEPRAYAVQYRGIGLAELLMMMREEGRGGRGGNGTSRMMAKAETELDNLKWDELRVIGPQQHQHLLSGLRAYSLYQVRISAENGVGRSVAGPIVRVITHEAVPAQAPKFSAELMDQGGVEVKWEQIEPEQANGQIIGYKIRLVEMGRNESGGEEIAVNQGMMNSQLEREISARERRSIRFPSKVLRPNRAYAISVKAQTIIGEGPLEGRRQTVIVRTPEEVPDPPVNASFIFKSPTELRLGWARPNWPKGKILHYGVNYWRHGDPRPSLPFTEVPPHLWTFSATQLRPNSTYFFALKAQTAIGWGTERVLKVSTNRQKVPLPIPPIPIRDTSKPQSASSLHLKWDKEEEEDLANSLAVRSIEMEWQTAEGNAENWTRLAELIPAERGGHSLERLHPNTAYRMRLRLIGDLGQNSAWSIPSQWLQTMEAPPTRPPTDVQLETVPNDQTALKVRWHPLDRRDWNADRIGYRVLYRVYQPEAAEELYSDLPQAEEFSIVELTLAAASTDDQRDGQIEVQLKGLKKFRHYLVQVHSFNVLGQSPPSRPPRFIFIGHNRPQLVVQNLRAESPTSTSIQVKWDPPKEENEIEGGRGKDMEGKEANEDGIGKGFYRIRWSVVAGGSVEGGEEHLTLTEGTQLLLTNLHKWTKYRVGVSQYNRAGEGPLATVLARTLEDLPGPIGQIQFRDVLTNSIKLLWNAPAETNGNLTGFVLLYRTSRQKSAASEGREWGKQQHQQMGAVSELFPKKEVQLRTTRMEMVLDQLDENVTYFVSIRAETAAGLGPERTAEVTTGFNPGAPEAPKGQPALIPEQADVLIQWQNGPSGNGPIIGHLVQAKRVGIGSTATTAAAMNLLQMDEKRSLQEGGGRHSNSEDGIMPSNSAKNVRHIIGHWLTVDLINSGPSTNEWRIPYRSLEPNSYYVFRVFARNELGIGRPSADSEQLHVPTSIPEEPFYGEWWFLSLVGALLALIIVGFVTFLLLQCKMGKGNGHGQEEKRKKSAKGKRAKVGGNNKGRMGSIGGGGGDAFDTLSDGAGGIVSYELYGQRNEQRGDQMALFSRPNTKQSWVGSIRNSPAVSNRSANLGAIYGSIDEGEDNNGYGKNNNKATGGGGEGGGGNMPNMYSVLATDSMRPILNGATSRNGSTHTLYNMSNEGEAQRRAAAIKQQCNNNQIIPCNGQQQLRQRGQHSTTTTPTATATIIDNNSGNGPYYQLRQFNGLSGEDALAVGGGALQISNGIYYEEADGTNYGGRRRMEEAADLEEKVQRDEENPMDGGGGGLPLTPFYNLHQNAPDHLREMDSAVGGDLLADHYNNQQSERRELWRRTREQQQQQQQLMLRQRQKAPPPPLALGHHQHRSATPTAIGASYDNEGEGMDEEMIKRISSGQSSVFDFGSHQQQAANYYCSDDFGGGGGGIAQFGIPFAISSSSSAPFTGHLQQNQQQQQSQRNSNNEITGLSSFV